MLCGGKCYEMSLERFHIVDMYNVFDISIRLLISTIMCYFQLIKPLSAVMKSHYAYEYLNDIIKLQFKGLSASI